MTCDARDHHSRDRPAGMERGITGAQRRLSTILGILELILSDEMKLHDRTIALCLLSNGGP